MTLRSKVLPMFMMFTFVVGVVVTMYLCFTTFALASPPVALPSPDYLTEKEFAIYGNLNCNNHNAIAGFIWNYSDFYTPKEQCELYTQAAKIMHTKIGIELEANITITNITMKH
jgi:hypothetical protein